MFRKLRIYLHWLEKTFSCTGQYSFVHMHFLGAFWINRHILFKLRDAYYNDDFFSIEVN